MEYKPPAGPPPNHNKQQWSSNNPYMGAGSRPSHRGDSGTDTIYQPPSGPPPSHRTGEHQPPVGLPPSHEAGKHLTGSGQPSIYNTDEEEPPPYDPWLAIPDNALLPPPPPMMEDYSPANNASNADATRARLWCKQNTLWEPRTWNMKALEQIHDHQFSLTAQPSARAVTIQASGKGRTSVTTTKRQSDTTILSSLPLYVPQSQAAVSQERTIYFQVHVKHLSGSDATVALGFLAPPYPPNRLPGWHRGSLAVHNDDGRRYVNDDDGGVDFVRPFGAGDDVGIGMTFTHSKVRVFFTRNGREEGSWDLHESRDVAASDGGVSGLDGTTDLYAAIGICGGAELEVKWLN